METKSFDEYCMYCGYYEEDCSGVCLGFDSFDEVEETKDFLDRCLTEVGFFKFYRPDRDF